MGGRVKKVIHPGLEIELRIRRPPAAPLLVNFDVCVRLGPGGAILASTKNVPPTQLHRIISTMAKAPTSDKQKTKVVGVLGDCE